MSLKYYYDLMSQPCRAMMIFLKKNNIPFVDCPVALRKGEHLSDDFAKLNPMKRVPVITDQDFTLTETVAIFRYICATHPSLPDHWYPADIKLRARVDEYMAWQHTNLRIYGSMVFQHRVVKPRLTGKPIDEKSLERFKGDLEDTLSAMERVLLRDGKFINNLEQISFADLMAVCELEQPLAGGYNFLPDHPIIEQYMQRVERTVGSELYTEIHQHIRRVRDMVNSGNL